jgi:hypothetical protein
MRILKPISLLRSIAIAACLAAAVVYSSFAPQPVFACGEAGCCGCDNGQYSHGACQGTAQCMCMTEPSCSCWWVQPSPLCQPIID